MKNRRKRNIIIAIIVMLIGMLSLYYIWKIWRENKSINNGYEPYQIEKNEQNNLFNHTKLVYITGGVGEPGIYEVKNNIHLVDVVNKAGGLLPYADASKINMAKEVEDGEHIHIPFNFAGDIAELTRKAKININLANENELILIKGVGPATAKRIIEYRKVKNKFKKIEDIQEIKGIGKGTFEKIKDSICV